MPEWPDGRGKWEPRGFYVFRRLVQICVGLLALLGLVFLVVVTEFPPAMPIIIIPLLVAAGVALAGIAVAFVGLIITAPTRKERRRRKADDELKRPEQHF